MGNQSFDPISYKDHQRQLWDSISAGWEKLWPRRADAIGLKNMEFSEMDAEEMGFPEGSFDSILSRFSLMFLPGLSTILKKIRWMLAPDGKLLSLRS